MSDMVTRWWWVRHAPVMGDQNRLSGHRDVDADCADIAAFKGLAATLPQGAVLVTSHLKRTRQTAAAIAEAGLDLPEPVIEPGIAEQHFGEWQGLTWDEVFDRPDSDRHRFWRYPDTEAPPGGESFHQVVGRVRNAVAALSAKYAGRDIIAVGHGGSIRAALAMALGIEAEKVLAFQVANLSLTRLEFLQAAWRVELVNGRALGPDK